MMRIEARRIFEPLSDAWSIQVTDGRSTCAFLEDPDEPLSSQRLRAEVAEHVSYTLWSAAHPHPARQQGSWERGERRFRNLVTKAMEDVWE